MASKQNKKVMNVQAKSKIIKSKAATSKSKAKTVITSGKKALLVKEKDKKNQPAPITEPGYSLYSTESENTSANTWEQDACFEVLKKLREKKEKEYVATAVNAVPKAHFNERLSSSTPDPEKVSPEKHHFQLIPERDTTPTSKEQLPTETGVSYTDQWMAGHMFSNPNDHSFGHSGTQMLQRAPYVNPAQMTFGGTSQLLNYFPSSLPANLGHGHVMHNIAPPGAPQTSLIQPAHNVAPGAPSSNFGKHSGVGRGVTPGPFGNSDISTQAVTTVPTQSLPAQNGNVNVEGTPLVQTSSEGFVPLSNIYFESQRDTRRVSDIGAFQAFIPRDSLGFSPLGETPQVYKEPRTDRTNLSGDSRKDHSGSLGERSVCSQGPSSTPNSSGYVGLPTPKGNGKIVPDGIPAMQNENGLFQIHAHVEPCKDNIQARNGVSSIPGLSDLHVYPPQTTTSAQPNSMMYQGHNSEIPERDTAVPVSNNVPSVVTATSSNKTPDASLNSQKGSSGLSQGSNHHVSGSDHTGSDHNNSLRDSNFPVSQQQVPPIFLPQSSPRTHVPSNVYPGENAVMQPVFLTYTANGAQIIPLKIADQNVAIQGQQQLAGYGLSMPLQGIVSQSQASNQKSLNSDRTPRSVSTESEGTKHDSVSETPNNNPVSPNPWSKVKTDAKLKRVRYLLSELKECGKISKDVEVQRLAKDIEKSLDKVPQLSSTFSLQAEIDLAIQPLRSENSQLRRRLRLINQQLKDQQIETDKIKQIKAVDLDVLHLQGANSALQKQIADLREDKVKLATEVTELNSNLQKMKIEKNKLLSSYSEKEMEDFRIKQECLAETQKYRDEADKHKRLVESSHLKHQAAEQECHILKITLQQSETEITRLQEIVETMKEGMAELLQELEHNKTVDKSWRENNSFGIQKLVKILEGDRPISPSCLASDQDKTLSNNGDKKHTSQNPQTNLQNQKDNLRANPQRLTKQALADHDKIHSARSADKAYATSDTEAEMVMETKHKRYKRSPLRRRHSSHSPQARRHSLKNTNIHHSEDFHRNSEKYVGPLQKQNVEEIFHMLPKNYRSDDKSQNGPNVDKRIGFVNNDYDYQREAIEGQSEAEKENDSDEFYYVVQPRQGQSDQRELVFLDQSRYSVTDYFRKYSQQATSSNLDTRWHRRSLSQPNRPLKETENKRNVYSSQTSDNVNHGNKLHARSNSQDMYMPEHGMVRERQKTVTYKTGEMHQKQTQNAGEMYQRMPRNTGEMYQRSPRNTGELHQRLPQNTGDMFQRQNTDEMYQRSPRNMGEMYQRSPPNTGEMYRRSPPNTNGMYHRQEENRADRLTGDNYGEYEDEGCDDLNFRNNTDNRHRKMIKRNDNRNEGLGGYRVGPQGGEVDYERSPPEQYFSDSGKREDDTLRKQLHFRDVPNRPIGNSRNLPPSHENGPQQGFRSNTLPRNQKFKNHPVQRSNQKIQRSEGYSRPDNMTNGHPYTQDHVPSRINHGNMQQVHYHGNQNLAKSPQDHLFQGTVLDNSISAIVDDDNVSSVSAKTATSSSTVDDSTFRKGIATLDANILKLQLALQKTKKMLT